MAQGASTPHGFPLVYHLGSSRMPYIPLYGRILLVMRVLTDSSFFFGISSKDLWVVMVWGDS